MLKSATDAVTCSQKNFVRHHTTSWSSMWIGVCYAGHLVLCYKEKIELLHRVMARGHRSVWFLLLSACRFVEFDTSIICHLLVYCFLLISIARYIFKSPRICFWGTKYDVYRERVFYLHCILLWRRARLWDRKENGKCTNATNCRSRVGLSTSFCTDLFIWTGPVLHRARHTSTQATSRSIKQKLRTQHLASTPF